MIQRIQRFKENLLFLTVFTLPMFIKLNNYFLGALIVIGLIQLFVVRNREGLKRVLLFGWPVYSFFLLAVIGSFYEPSWDSFKYLERYLSLLFLPLILIADSSVYEQRLKSIQKALLFGTLATLLICYANVLFEMNVKNEPISYFFRWRHLGHQFTEIADTHPAYLGLFIVVSQVYLLRAPNLPSWFRIMAFLTLSAGLFQLASRMALILFFFLFLGIVIHRLRRKKWHMLVLLAGLLLCTVTFLNYGSDYLKRRLFSSESVLEDKRFSRWEVSYEIFRENPILGVGLKRIEPIRHQRYSEMGFDDAAAKDLNAHNQFLEYLSRNGALGGVIFVVSLSFLILLAFFQKDLYFTAVFALFVLASLTESTMVRIMGIEFFALFGSVFLSKPSD
jgi:O-antigen ligase